MGTAVLAEEPGVLLDREIWSGKEDAPKHENVFERVAHRLRLDGHDAEVVYEDDEGFDFAKYLGEDAVKYLDSLPPVTEWERKK
jgi:hypothetical protein